jgi:hypothetical protein
METKTITIDQFLTPSEIKRARELYRELRGSGKFAATMDAEIITPNLARINKALGQENNARYLAYAVEYVLTGISITLPRNRGR